MGLIAKRITCLHDTILSVRAVAPRISPSRLPALFLFTRSSIRRERREKPRRAARVLTPVLIGLIIPADLASNFSLVIIGPKRASIYNGPLIHVNVASTIIVDGTRWRRREERKKERRKKKNETTLEVHLFRQLVSSRYKVDSSRKRKRVSRPGERETIERASASERRDSSGVLFRQAGILHTRRTSRAASARQ